MKITWSIKRIYDEPADDDGFRVLVDRLWPRGLSKADAHIDLWTREIAPSNDLRHWFGHAPEKWEDFCQRYGAELDDNSQAVQALRQALAEHDRATLLYAAKDEQHNNAAVLFEYLTGR